MKGLTHPQGGNASNDSDCLADYLSPTWRALLDVGAALPVALVDDPRFRFRVRLSHKAV